MQHPILRNGPALAKHIFSELISSLEFVSFMREDVNSLLCARLIFFNLRECSDLLLDATLFSGRPMSGSTFTIYEAGKIRETLSRTCCQNRQETGCPSRTPVESVFQNMCVKRGCLKTPSPLTCETFNPRYYTSLLVIVAD